MVRSPNRYVRALAALALACAAATLVGGCGTPAVVKPAATPLPGLQRAIHAAQGVIAQTERQAQADATTSVGSP